MHAVPEAPAASSACCASVRGPGWARAGSTIVAFNDHPNEKRFADRIETVTVNSVLDWLARSGLATPAQSISL